MYPIKNVNAPGCVFILTATLQQKPLQSIKKTTHFYGQLFITLGIQNYIQADIAHNTNGKLKMGIANFFIRSDIIRKKAVESNKCYHTFNLASYKNEFRSSTGENRGKFLDLNVLMNNAAIIELFCLRESMIIDRLFNINIYGLVAYSSPTLIATEEYIRQILPINVQGKFLVVQTMYKAWMQIWRQNIPCPVCLLRRENFIFFLLLYLNKFVSENVCVHFSNYCPSFSSYLDCYFATSTLV